MATTVHQPPAIETRTIRSNGGGGAGPLGPQNGRLRTAQGYAPVPSKTGIWTGLAAISMMFAAFTSALIVRQGAGNDWHHLVLPPILFFNTLMLLASSGTLELARRRIAVFMGGRSDEVRPAQWLYATLFLGAIFVVGQYIAWLQLRAEGLYLATNPNSSFFYLLTAVHALHVLGGLTGLVLVLSRLNRLTLRRSTLDSFSYYWHFMGILWVYLMFLLWMRL